MTALCLHYAFYFAIDRNIGVVENCFAAIFFNFGNNGMCCSERSADTISAATLGIDDDGRQKPGHSCDLRHFRRQEQWLFLIKMNGLAASVTNIILTRAAFLGLRVYKSKVSNL
ncbi:MAG: hypothetical protein ACI9SK_002061 [Zhongshania sp.]